jgi:hypothetical protein
MSKVRIFIPSTRDWRTYVDLFTAFPFLLLAFISATELFQKPFSSYREGLVLFVTLLLLLIVREKLSFIAVCLLLIAGLAGYSLRWGVQRSVFDVVCLIAIFLVGSALGGLVLRHTKKSSPVLRLIDHFGGFELLLMVLSMIFAFALLYGVSLIFPS